MINNVRFEFKLKTEVGIIPLELSGIIIALHCDHLGIQYRVRYIRESEVCFDYFWAEELEVV